MSNITIINGTLDVSSPDLLECRTYNIALTLSNPAQVNINYTSCTDGAPSVYDFQTTQAVAPGIETTLRLDGFCSLTIPTLTFEREVPHTLEVIDRGLCEVSPSDSPSPRSPDEPPSSNPDEPEMPSVDPSQPDSPSDDIPSNDPSAPEPDYPDFYAARGPEGDIPLPSFVHYVMLLPDTLSGWVTYKDADGQLKEREVIQRNPDDMAMPMMMICAKEVVEHEGVSVEKTEEYCP